MIRHHFPHTGRPLRRAAAGFTLPEALIATGLFALLVLGVVSATVFGLQWYEIGQTNLIATDSAREAIGKMSDELRGCDNAVVGTISNGAFVATVNGEFQSGNGLMIYPTSSTNDYVLYYLNSTNQDFIRYSTDTLSNAVVAESVTNTTVFQAQDLHGNVLTNTQNGCVIYCSLQFYVAPPQSPVSGYYQVQTAVAPRAMN
jgi:hypothetical protein